MGRSDAGRKHRAGLPPIIGSAPRALILGTIPSVQSALKGQYYGNPLNHFWRLMADVLEEEMPEDYSGRCEVLKGNGIAVWDVLAECDIRGSGDHSISDPVPNDLPAFLKENEGVHHLFINGKTALKFYRHFNSEAIEREVTLLPSSSPANAIRYADRRLAWMVIRDALRS
jgi:hypoxanthine-DNA glycosylase